MIKSKYFGSFVSCYEVENHKEQFLPWSCFQTLLQSIDLSVFLSTNPTLSWSLFGESSSQIDL